MWVSSLGGLAGQKENMDNQILLKHQELAFCLPKQHSTRDETLWPGLSIEFSVVLAAEIIESWFWGLFVDLILFCFVCVFISRSKCCSSC